MLVRHIKNQDFNMRLIKAMSYKTLIILMAMLGGLVVAACNTIEGAGEDIESVGEEIQD